MKQQIIISGLGGQGVLFVTRVLAEAAILRGFPVITSETHGMAQRGGTVVSHLKVGDFSSPLIRPSQADGLLALESENLPQHGPYLKQGGWAVINCLELSEIYQRCSWQVFATDAQTLARKLGNPRAVNLILLGAVLGNIRENVFCSYEDIRAVLETRLANKKEMLNAIEAGLRIKGESYPLNP